VIIASIVDERSRGLAAGAADYLVKPVGRDELLGALRRVHALPTRNIERSA
jgi:DNA-binding response OmpR family regulator